MHSGDYWCYIYSLFFLTLNVTVNLFHDRSLWFLYDRDLNHERVYPFFSNAPFWFQCVFCSQGAPKEKTGNKWVNDVDLIFIPTEKYLFKLNNITPKQHQGNLRLSLCWSGENRNFSIKLLLAFIETFWWLRSWQNICANESLLIPKQNI